MKPIIVKDQVRLGPGRCLMLTLSGMYYRMSRSAITVLILSLAVAFLSYVLYYGIISHDTDYSVGRELRSNRLLGEWTSRLSAPDQLEVILATMVSGNRERIDEYRAWGELTEDDIGTLTATAVRLGNFVRYFDGIPRTSRAMLVADQDPRVLAGELSDPERFDAFAAKIVELKLQPPFKDIDAGRSLVSTELPKAVAMVERIRSGQRRAIATVQDELGDPESLHNWFLEPTELFTDALTRAGFRMSAATLQRLSELTRLDLDTRRLSQALESPEIKGLAARTMGVGSIREFNPERYLPWALSPNKAAWLSTTVAGQPGGSELTPERLMSLARFTKRAAHLQRVFRDDSALQPRTTVFQLPERTRWLILVSFLVCIIGIANTMFMSVTDRFSEIATMKCIGAMDGFIMLLFVYEALFQALAGSLGGVVLGLLLSFLRAWATYGVLAFEAIPALDLLAVTGVSFVTGIIIAALAAIFPAWAAARLAPMEAMRVE